MVLQYVKLCRLKTNCMFMTYHCFTFTRFDCIEYFPKRISVNSQRGAWRWPILKDPNLSRLLGINEPNNHVQSDLPYNAYPNFSFKHMTPLSFVAHFGLSDCILTISFKWPVSLWKNLPNMWNFEANLHPGGFTLLSSWTPRAIKKTTLHKASPKWVKILSIFFTSTYTMYLLHSKKMVTKYDDLYFS